MPEPLPCPTIEQAIEKYLNEPELDPYVHEQTHKTYRTGLAAFASFLPAIDLSPTSASDRLPPTVLRDFYRWLLKQEPVHTPGERLSPLTVSTYLAAVSGLLRYLELRYASQSVLSFELERARSVLGQVETPYPLLNVPEQMPRIITYYDNLPLPEDLSTKRAQNEYLNILRNRAIMHTLYSSAGRISEVAALNRADVEEGYREETLIVGKGGKARPIYFTDEARATIRAYLAARQDNVSALFVNHHVRDLSKRARLSKKSIWQVVKEAGRSVGVPEVTPHYFRHYRGSVLLEAGLSLPEVQQILGHESIQTTRRIYIHLDREKLKWAFFECSPSPQELLDELEQKEQERESR